MGAFFSVPSTFISAAIADAETMAIAKKLMDYDDNLGSFLIKFFDAVSMFATPPSREDT